MAVQWNVHVYLALFSLSLAYKKRYQRQNEDIKTNKINTYLKIAFNLSTISSGYICARVGSKKALA